MRQATTQRRKTNAEMCIFAGSLAMGVDSFPIGGPERPHIPLTGHEDLYARGRSNEKVEPSPSRDVTQMRPSMRCTSSRQM